MPCPRINLTFFLCRALLREVIRALRHDLPLPTFCAALLQGCMQERRKAAIREFEFKVWKLKNILGPQQNFFFSFRIASWIRWRTWPLYAFFSRLVRVFVNRHRWWLVEIWEKWNYFDSSTCRRRLFNGNRSIGCKLQFLPYLNLIEWITFTASAK